MARANRFRFRFPLFAVTSLFLVAAAAFAARSYLSSRHAADQVRARLAAVYGGPLELDAVEIGVDNSTLHGLRLFESDGEDREPWLKADDLQADAGAWDLLNGGPSPSSLQVSGVSITICFDAQGHLLTRIPRPAGERKLPAIHITDGTFTLQQDGRPPLVVHGMDATLEHDDGEVRLRATAADPAWGEWSANAHVATEGGAGEMILETERTQATTANLTSLPFVSPVVWEEVQVEGPTPARLTLRFDLAAGSCKYRIVAAPETASVFIRSISLRAEQVKGEVVIEDGYVQLNNLHGRTADGDIETTGDLDFRIRPRVMNFHIRVHHVDIHRLPKTWHIPPLAVGRLNGRADLKVTVGGEPHVLTTGGGKGAINGTIPIALTADASGFHFSLTKPDLKSGVGQP